MDSTERTSIDLGFAELSFLLAIASGSNGHDAMQRLGLPSVIQADPVAQAGLSSLAARGLAGLEEDAVKLTPELGSVLAGLCLPRQHATFTVGSADEMAVMQVFLGERQNLMVEPLAFGVFRIVGLSDDASLAGIASTLVKTLRTGGRLAVGVGDTLIQVGWGDAQATITTAGVTTQVGFDDVPHLLQQSLDVAG